MKLLAVAGPDITGILSGLGHETTVARDAEEFKRHLDSTVFDALVFEDVGVGLHMLKWFEKHADKRPKNIVVMAADQVRKEEIELLDGMCVVVEPGFQIELGKALKRERAFEVT